MSAIVPVPINKVLATVDGSDFSEKAGYTAAQIALRYSKQLYIIHVAKYPPNSLGVGGTHTVAVGLPLPDPIADQLKKRAVASMDRIAAYATKLSVSTSKRIIETSSSIVESVANYAYQNNIDLIVVGAKGLNAFSSALMGSVSEGIVQEARCSVMVIK